MINRNFYDPNKAVRLYLGGKINHYLRRDRTVVLKSYAYTLQEGEDMYMMGLKVFGGDRMNLWPIIADNNSLRMPEYWNPGEIVNLPLVVLNDPEIRAANYESATSLSTAV